LVIPVADRGRGSGRTGRGQTLGPYQSKSVDFRPAKPEPAGAGGAPHRPMGSRRFVRPAQTVPGRVHYDLRFEIDGVL